MTAAAAGCVSAGLLLGPRVVYALAKDGLFPQAFGRVHPRFRTPGFAIVIQAVWTSLLCFSGRYDQLYTYAIFAVILAYAGTGVALLLFRRRLPNLPRPYRCSGLSGRPDRLRGDVAGPGRQHHPRAAPRDADRSRHPDPRRSRSTSGCAPPRGGEWVAGGAMRRAVSFGLLALLGASAPPQTSQTPATAPLTGFSPQRTAWQRDYEGRFLALPAARGVRRDPPRADAHAARGRHRGKRARGAIPGSPTSTARPASRSRCPSYDVLLSYPKSARLEIVGEPPVALGRGEAPIPSDPDTAIPEARLAVERLRADGRRHRARSSTSTAASAEDYDRLARMGVDVRGKIALARYFGGYRGGKSLEAEKRGVLALLVYSDPFDDGWFQGAVYPDGPWGPPSHFQRGANVYDFIAPGRSADAGLGVDQGREADSDLGVRDPPEDADDAALGARRGGDPAAARREDRARLGLAGPRRRRHDARRAGPGPPAHARSRTRARRGRSAT